jgi:uncharacterized SAM-binding protein YcdF (DUF218 family)
MLFLPDMKGIIIVLGAPNSDAGQLSEMALNRLDCAVRFYFNNPGFKILCTGGFGEHFNRTATPHAEYASRYLVAHHIPAGDILEYALSRHTPEDATLSKPILDKYAPPLVVIITSDFHMKRVRLVFNTYLPNYPLLFVEAASTMDESTLTRLREHETNAIQRFTSGHCS